jgi:hypothetical protein
MTPPSNWAQLNQSYLLQLVKSLHQRLKANLAKGRATRAPLPAPPWPAELPPPALDTLARVLCLSDFERQVVLLCAAAELDFALAQTCAALQGTPPRPYPTLELALKQLPNPHWNALTPAAPLRHWQLVEPLGDEPLTSRPLRLDERMLHFLMGVSYLDPELAQYATPLGAPPALPPSQQALAAQIQQQWQQAAPGAINLHGGTVANRDAIAAAAAQPLGLHLYAIEADALPTDGDRRYRWQRRWEREAALGSSALVVRLGGPPDREQLPVLTAFLQRQGGRLLVSSPDPLLLIQRPLVRLAVPPPHPAEQAQLWQRALGPLAAAAQPHLGPLISQFQLDPADIVEIGQAVQSAAPPEESLGDRLWQSCRQRARVALDDLAQRLDPAATWDDLVLPEAQRRTLAAIVVGVQQRSQVYDRWGFGQKSHRGLGISALFAGGSGTGKTMAAEVLAQALRLDLYRIDLSAVVSKYIGETEKNLRRIFDAAEQGGVILLFDEADALFGKRSEVKDSHDRHANIEVSYLLQRMETYRGLAILTTNFKAAIDSAFLRRIRFVVPFPFPDVAQRQDIWQHMFPAQTPTAGLDYAKLARLSVAGGNIHSIALNAAFLAAAEQSPVQMSHLLRATQSEYAKLDKPLAEAGVRGWI